MTYILTAADIFQLLALYHNIFYFYFTTDLSVGRHLCFDSETKNDITGQKNDITGQKNDITGQKNDITGQDLVPYSDNYRTFLSKKFTIEIHLGVLCT